MTSPQDSLGAATPDGRGRRTPIVIAFLLGALLAAGVAVGGDRLKENFHSMGRIEGDPSADPDGDGLASSVERRGWTTRAGETFTTDPDVADTDSDGLTDGEEAGAVFTRGSRSVFVGISDPGTPDTDADGVVDGDEYFLGTDPGSQDTDADGLSDLEELDFGSDPLVNNPDGDAYSDQIERERASSPLMYDASGLRAKFNTGLTALKLALSAADKVTGGGRLAVVLKAVSAARAVGVAVPLIWDALRQWDWSRIETDQLVDEIFGDEMTELGEALEGGASEYLAYAGRRPDGALAYVGITSDLDELLASHGGLNTLNVIGGESPVPLGQARAIAEAAISSADDQLHAPTLANRRHLIDPANIQYAVALRWGREKLVLTDFELRSVT